MNFTTTTRTHEEFHNLKKGIQRISESKPGHTSNFTTSTYDRFYNPNQNIGRISQFQPGRTTNFRIPN